LKEDGTGSAQTTGKEIPVQIKQGTMPRINSKLRYYFLVAKAAGGACIPLYMYIAICFILGAIEGWSVLDTVYFSVITVTTVGFGDVTPDTQDGRLFAAFLLPFGLVALVVTSGMVGSEVMKVGQAKDKTISDLLDELAEVIEEDDDGIVTEEEYLVHCLKKDKIVDEEQLDLLRKQFQALDADGSGELDEDDITQLTEAAKAHAEAAEAAKANSRRSSTASSGPTTVLEM
jgi:hypothetical protein